MPAAVCRRAGFCAAAITIASFGITGAGAQSLPFEGRWALRADGCAPPADPAQPHQPIVLTAKRLVAAPAMSCDFASVLPGGASFRVEADCDADGQKGREFFTFAVLGGRLYWSWAGRTQDFARCPD